MEIVTGSTGQVHVTSIDDAVRNGNPGYLNGKVVFTFLQNFAATIVTNNQVKIGSGYGMNQGRIFKIDEGEFDLVTIENGSQGYKRTDIIVARYTMNTQSGFEDIHLEAIRGTSGNSYVDPAYSTGNINQGATQDDMPLYRVKINGLVIEAVERMFTLVPDGGRLGELEAKYENHMKYFNKVNIRTNLSTENVPLLKDGGETGNIRPGVEGTLPVSHGGTGQTTLKAAGDSIIGNLGDNNTAPTDNTVFIGSTPSTSGFQKKTMASLWTYLTGKIRALLGMGNNDVVPIAHGGTGKTSIGNSAILVGSNGAFVEKTLTIDLKDPNDNKIPTTKAVSEALSKAGYGDMMKDTYDPNEDGIIAIANGGTGANTVAGARNALGLGNTTGALPIANGGTGQTTAAAARNALGLGNTTGALPAANGGTGQTSLQATRNAMGLGNTTGALPIANGGTGQTTAAAARNALGLGNTTGALPVANGGTGATSVSAARTNLGVPPTNHASSATTYGIGNASNYGHVKLTDSYTSTSAASSGIAASAKALKSLHDIMPNYDSTIAKLQEDIEYIEDSYMSKGGGTFTGPVTFANVIVDSTQIVKQGDVVRLSLGNDVAAAEGSASYQVASGGALRFYNRGTGFYSQFRFEGRALTNSRAILIPDKQGTLQIASPSSRRIKENIRDMSEERAKKLLDIEIVNFDYIGTYGGGLKDQSGVIAEDAIKIIPEAVTIPKDYDETMPIDENDLLPEVDYRQYIPYLIKMVQMQQKEIEELKAALNK